MAKKFEDCMVEGCEMKGRPAVCPGDGRYHHHGAIHTLNSERINDLPLEKAWGWLCGIHLAMANAEWEERRASRVG